MARNIMCRAIPGPPGEAHIKSLSAPRHKPLDREPGGAGGNSQTACGLVIAGQIFV